jgi:hypothetical protein
VVFTVADSNFTSNKAALLLSHELSLGSTTRKMLAVMMTPSLSKKLLGGKVHGVYPL